MVPGEANVAVKLRLQIRRELLEQMAPQYREAPPAKKRVLLDEFTHLTGYHRTYAQWLLNHSQQVLQKRGRSVRPHHYGPEVRDALVQLWNAANRICSKRLMPFLPTLIEAWEQHGHLHLTEACHNQLLSMSAATADRLLRPLRGRGPHGVATTRAGTWLKQQIPIQHGRAFHFRFWDWTPIMGVNLSMNACSPIVKPNRSPLREDARVSRMIKTS